MQKLQNNKQVTKPYLFFLLIYYFIQFVDSASVAPTYGKSNYFDSGRLKLLQTATATTFQYTAFFHRTFVSFPTIIRSFSSLNYNLNYLFNNLHDLTLTLSISTLSVNGFTAVTTTNSPLRLNSIQFSFLAIDPTFMYYGSFQITSFSFINTALFIQILNIPSELYRNLILINGLILVRSDVPFNSYSHWFDILFDFSIINASTPTTNSFTYRFDLNTWDTYYQTFRVQTTIVIFPNSISNQISRHQIYFQSWENSSFSYMDPSSYSSFYGKDKTVFFVGLSQFFSTAANDNPLIDNCWFNFLQASYLNFTTSKSWFFSRLNFSIIIINQKKCDDPLYPFYKYNSLNGMYQCFDSCETNQYYNILYGVRYCYTCHTNCTKCISYSNCYECKLNYQLTINNTCLLTNRFTVNNSAIVLCISLMPGCDTCSDNITCTSCINSSYVFSTSTCQACTSLYNINCLKCDPTYCLQCTSGLVLNNGLTCQNFSNSGGGTVICNQNICKYCDTANLSSCSLCYDQQMPIIDGFCTILCGDGKIMSNQQCDDQNTLQNDGCSSSCQIQSGYQCTQAQFSTISKYNKSTCFINGNIKYNVEYIEKIKGLNRVQIKLNIYPALPIHIWDIINFKSMMIFSGPASPFIKNIQFYKTQLADKTFSLRRFLQNLQSRTIYLYFDYTENMQNMILGIEIDPTLSGVSALSTGLQYNNSLVIISRNNHLVNAYSQQVYYHSALIYNLSLVIGLLTFLTIILGIFTGKMDMVFQFAGIIQFSYFGLLYVGQLNPLFNGLTALKLASGINPSLRYSDPIQDLQNLKTFVGIQMYSNFSDNANLTIILILIFILLGFSLRFLRKLKCFSKQKSKIIKQYHYRIFGSAPLYLLLCFSYLISVSICANIYTLSSNIIGYVLGLISILILVGYIFMFIKFGQNHLFFKDLTLKMKQNKKLYIFSTLIVRNLIGALLVFCIKIQGFIVPLVIIAILTIQSSIFIIKFNVYNKTRQGLFIFNKISSLVSPIIYLISRIHFQNINQTNLSIYLALTIIILSYLIFTINFLFYFYSIKKFRCCQLSVYEEGLFKKKVKDIQIDIQDDSLSNKISGKDNKEKQSNKQENEIIFSNSLQSPTNIKNRILHQSRVPNSKQKIKDSQLYQQSFNKLNILQSGFSPTNRKQQFRKKLLHQLDVSFQSSIQENFNYISTKYPNIITKMKNNQSFTNQQRQQLKIQIKKQIKKQLANNMLNNNNTLLINGKISDKIKSTNNQKITDILKNKQSKKSKDFINPDQIYERLNRNMTQQVQQKQFKYEYTNKNLYVPWQQFDKI